MREPCVVSVRRCHRSAPFLAGSRVEYVGRRTIVLGRPDGDLVYLTDDAVGLLPGGVTVSAGLWARLAGTLGSQPSGELLEASWLEPVLPPAVDLGLPAGGVAPGRAARLAVLLDAASQSDLAAGGVDAPTMACRLVRSAAAPRQVLAELVGTGPGTTPAGDDVILGVLLGCRLAGRSSAVTALCACLPALLPGTTRASRHFLVWAIRGAFASPVRDLAFALQGRAELEPAFGRLARWGATSGRDVAWGVRAAVAPEDQLPVQPRGMAA